MDGGALLYVLIFVVLAVVQGLGQKRREAERKSQTKPGGGAPAPGSAPGEPRPLPRARRSPTPDSSEGLIPSEVWEEILGLARGKPSPPTPVDAPPEPAPAPAGRSADRRREEIEIYRAPGSLEEIPSFEARSLEDLRPRQAELSQRELPPPSREVRPRRGALLTPHMGRQRHSGRSRWMRKELLGSGSAEELRRAMVLSEVLGPPLSLRE